MILINNRHVEQKRGQCLKKCLALLLSVLTMIGSGFIVGFGIQTLREVSFTASVIGTNLIVYCPYLLILVGILSFVMTPVRFFSIILNDNKIMITHMFATIFFATICAMTAILGYDLNSHVSSSDMEHWMKHSIKEDYGNPTAPHIMEEWNKAHRQFKCCGVRNLTDFVESKWYIMQKKHPRQRIPDSCCASCATMHERFCVAFFKEPGNQPHQLVKNQTICLQASNGCLSADSSIANREVCQHYSSDYRLSADAYRYTGGCLEPLRTTLEFFSFRIFIYSLSFLAFLALSTLIWLLNYQISREALPFQVIK
ncbi:Tetraspanin [Caenorhabditis elegans]|uniref:Tetraspanin n=1 Tax=Caenorhabditis elegans TaxID=6239 RepID=Q19083_CAEEL|nr:Tetraspanin [Caenorhabditis elegans]CCD83462.2 Tetraspanin [Caenorhabditis elegans]|eukprot:NP_509183.2 TetraSPanin family [Caenorhabditis elegans]